MWVDVVLCGFLWVGWPGLFGWANEPGGGHLGAVAGAGGPGGRALAGVGAGSGNAPDCTGAGVQSNWVAADGHISGFYYEQERANFQPRSGGGVDRLRRAAMGRAKEGQACDGDVAGATVASVRHQAENDSDWGRNCPKRTLISR